MLRDGRRFTIDYDQIPGKAWVDGTNGEVFPCGWFDLKEGYGRSLSFGACI